MVIKMKKDEILYKRIEANKKLHEKIVNDNLRNLNDKLKSEKYSVESLVKESSLGDTYHDLIDKKDLLNSELHSNINKTYHSIDVELYKLEKKIDGKARLLNYNFEKKKNKIFDEIKYH
jgi:hypothetical protein